MPTYSYRCTACDNAFDIQQSFIDDSLTVCSACDGKLRKVFSAIGVTFTGSGFYSNDSRASKSSSDSGSSDSGSSGSGSSAGSSAASSTPSTSSDSSSSSSSSSTSAASASAQAS